MEDIIDTFQKSILEEVNKQRLELNKLSVLLHQNIEDNANIPNAIAPVVTLADIHRGVSALVDEKNCLSRKYAFLDTQYRSVIKENAMLEVQNTKMDAMLKGYLIKYQPAVPLVPIQVRELLASQNANQNRDMVANDPNRKQLPVVSDDSASDSDMDDHCRNGRNSKCNQVATKTQALRPVPKEEQHQASHSRSHQSRDSSPIEPPEPVQVIEVSDADTQLYVCSELECDEIFTRKSRFDYHMKGHAGAHGKYGQGNRTKLGIKVLPKRKPLNGLKSAPAAGKRIKPKVRKQSRTGTKSASIVNKKRSRIVQDETGDEKEFICVIARCGKQFATKIQLQRHVQRHPENAKFCCNHKGCEKKFGFKADFKRHVLIHTGDRPFVCTAVGCTQKFTLKGNLLFHMKHLH